LAAYRRATGRPVVIIVEDPQRALGEHILLQELASCMEENNCNLVFLSSEADCADKLRGLSGWSQALEVVQMDPVDESLMRQHLAQVWHLDGRIIDRIVEQVGCGTRNVFVEILGKKS